MSLQVIKWSLCYKYLYDIGTFHIRHGILRYTDAYELVLSLLCLCSALCLYDAKQFTQHFNIFCRRTYTYIPLSFFFKQ